MTREKENDRKNLQIRRTTLQNCLSTTAKTDFNGFKRMLKCRWLLWLFGWRATADKNDMMTGRP